MNGLGKRRVQVLEVRAPVGCPTCRFWNWTIVMTVNEAGVETGRSSARTVDGWLPSGRCCNSWAWPGMRSRGMPEMGPHRLHARLDRLQERWPRRPRSSLDWSRLTDPEFARIEPLALRAMASPDAAAFVATLDSEDDAWLTTIAAKLDPAAE